MLSRWLQLVCAALYFGLAVSNAGLQFAGHKAFKYSMLLLWPPYCVAVSLALAPNLAIPAFVPAARGCATLVCLFVIAPIAIRFRGNIAVAGLMLSATALTQLCHIMRRMAALRQQHPQQHPHQHPHQHQHQHQHASWPRRKRACAPCFCPCRPCACCFFV